MRSSHSLDNLNHATAAGLWPVSLSCPVSVSRNNGLQQSCPMPMPHAMCRAACHDVINNGILPPHVLVIMMYSKTFPTKQDDA